MSTATMTEGRALLHTRAERHDHEAAAALVILEFIDDGRAWRHVDTDGIHWAAILGEGTWSSGEKVLLQLGWALWSGHGNVDVAYLFTMLSDSWTQAVVDAITARRGYQPLPVSRLGAL